MACYKPLRLASASYAKLVVSCGQCVGCRLERSRQWAVRIMHEASLYDANCFVTLTYDGAHVPNDRSLVYSDFQLFMRQLRKRLKSKYGRDFHVRFFMCGEYGDLGRPHFHACLFGFRPDDLVLYSENDGNKLYTSKFLSSIWKNGYLTVGELTFESAAYVARYVMKKQTGDGDNSYTDIIDVDTGEMHRRLKEFCRMSLKPGIGSEWYDRFHAEVRDGTVVVNGVESAAPKFYMRRMKRLVPDRYADIVARRFERSLERQAVIDRSPPRLSVRSKVAFARLMLSKRKLT